jgi:hypothetical protein
MLHASSAGVASIAVIASPPFPVAVKAPLHIVPIDHLDGSFHRAREPVANGTINSALDVNPVGEDDERREFVHANPWDSLALLYILDDLERFRPLADRIRRMAGPADLDVWDSRDPLPLCIAMAEGAV